MPTEERPADRIGLGIVHMVAGVAGLGVLNALVKLLAARYAIVEIAFFRSLFALAPAATMVVAAGGWRTLATARPWGHIWRGLCGLSCMYLIFWSFELMPLADAIAIGFSAPLFLTALSAPLLGERVGLFRWGAVLLGFAGVLVIVQPGGGGAMFGFGSLVALASAVAYALTMITIRKLGRTERSSTIVFYFMLTATVLSAMALPWFWRTPTLADLGLMVATGLCGGLTQHLITRAYMLAPAAVIGPFNYSALLWAALFGYLIWGELPGPSVALGAAIVAASGLAIVWRETRRPGAAP